MDELEILRLKETIRKLKRKKRHKASKLYKSLEKAFAQKKARVRVIKIRQIQQRKW